MDISKELIDLQNLKNNFDLLNKLNVYNSYGNYVNSYFEKDSIEQLIKSNFRIGDIIEINKSYFRICACFPSYCFNYPEFYYKLLEFDLNNYKTIPNSKQHYKKYYESELIKKTIIINKADETIK